MCADDLVGPHERPGVGMELGGGYVEHGQELPLKACEGKPEFDLLEHSGVYEAEGGVVAPLIVGADWLTGRTRPHNYFGTPWGVAGRRGVCPTGFRRRVARRWRRV